MLYQEGFWYGVITQIFFWICKSMLNFNSLCSFWQDNRGFSWYQNIHFDCLPLFISPWQQILFLFAILIFLYICFLSFTAFSSMFFLQHSHCLLFWPFYPRSYPQSSFRLFGGVVHFFQNEFFSSICTRSSIFLIKNKVEAFSREDSVPIICDPVTSIPKCIYSSKWSSTGSRGRHHERLSC